MNWQEAEIAVCAALRADPATVPLASSSLVPVPAGLSNFAWRARGAQGDRFVRLATRQTNRLGGDHHNECQVLRLVAPAGFAPTVIRCDPESRLLVTQWIEGGTPEGCVVGQGLPVPVAARTLAALHALDVPSGLRSVSFQTQALMLEQAGGGRTNGLASLAREVFMRLEADAPAPRLCHHDLHPLNLLVDPQARLWLLDWEYAGLGDPIFDLASVSSQHGLTSRQRATLVAWYRREGGAASPQRLNLARWAFDYVQSLWYRVAARSNDRSVDEGRLAARSLRLESSLRRRASSVLRCNNERLPDNGARV